MIATNVHQNLPDEQRVVITGIGLTAPNGNTLAEFRESLLAGRSGVQPYEIRYVGKTLAGICDFDADEISVAQGLAARDAGRKCGHLLARTKRLPIPGWTGRMSIRRGWACFWV